MKNWLRVCATGDVLPGEFKLVEHHGKSIALFNVEGKYYALDDVCTHDGSELTGGEIDGYEVECPRHGARFDIRTGEALCAPAYEPTAVYPTKAENGEVFILIDAD